MELLTHEEDREITVEKRNPGANVVYLQRLHCTHSSNADFKRLICFLTGRHTFVMGGAKNM